MKRFQKPIAGKFWTLVSEGAKGASSATPGRIPGGAHKSMSLCSLQSLPPPAPPPVPNMLDGLASLPIGAVRKSSGPSYMCAAAATPPPAMRARAIVTRDRREARMAPLGSKTNKRSKNTKRPTKWVKYLRSEWRKKPKRADSRDSPPPRFRKVRRSRCLADANATAEKRMRVQPSRRAKLPTTTYAEHETMDFLAKQWVWAPASKQPDDECVRVSFRETKQPALPSNVAEQPVLVYLCEGSAFKHFLTLRPSTIEGAGLGLFTAVKLYAGDVITRYVGPPKGPKKNTMEFDGRLHCPSACFPYGFAHFINEQAKRSDRGANVCNVVAHKDGTIVAMQDIDANEELFLYYGDDYERDYCL